MPFLTAKSLDPGRAGVSTLAQKNGSAVVKVESSGKRQEDELPYDKLKSISRPRARHFKHLRGRRLRRPLIGPRRRLPGLTIPFGQSRRRGRGGTRSGVVWQWRGRVHRREQNLRRACRADPCCFLRPSGVEDDGMNVFCLVGKVIGPALAWELIETFLTSYFSGAPRNRRRVAKVQAFENQTRENQEVGA